MCYAHSRHSVQNTTLIRLQGDHTVAGRIWALEGHTLAPFLQGCVTSRPRGSGDLHCVAPSAHKHLGHEAILASPGSVAMIVKKFPRVLFPGPQQSTPMSISPALGDTWNNLSPTGSTRYTHPVPAWESPAALCLGHSAALPQVRSSQAIQSFDNTSLRGPER